MRRLASIMPLAAAFVLSVAGPTHAADPLAAALADLDRHKAQGWAYTQKMNIAVMDEEAVTVVRRFDPAQPEGQRYEVLQILDKDGKPLTDKKKIDDAKSEADDMDLPSYSEVRRFVKGGTKLVREDADKAVYRVLPGKEGDDFSFGDITIAGSDMGEELEGTVTVRKAAQPFVSQVRFHLKKPSGTTLLAKVRALDVTYAFAPQGPDGIVLPTGFAFDFDLTTLVFIDVKMKIDLANSDFAFVGVAEGEQ
ncbi:MAG: hypothetical protein ACOY99_05170 [Pseudomonadota bacterium]